jgi:2-hydroxychromene-2-carboxylate isomerase
MRDHYRMVDRYGPGPLFFFGAMSPYSWFAAERIERLLPSAQWRGVLAGVVFKAHDRVSWGLTDQRADGIADCEARAATHGLGPMHWPDPWPTSDLAAARGMIYAETRGLLKEFSLSAMRLAFLEGCDLARHETVLEAGRRVGIAPGELTTALEDPTVKDGLRAVNDQALALGVFGVPTVAVGTELFWGDDRLDSAAHAYHARHGA